MDATPLPVIAPVFGTITRSVVAAVLKHLRSAEANQREFICVIDSEGGQFTNEFRDLLGQIRQSPVPTAAVIHQAASAAAMIALAVHRREIISDGCLELHNGVTVITGAQVDSDGRLPPILHNALREMGKLNQELMESCGARLTGAMNDTLSASGRLLLTARECLDVGIVEHVI